jgi:hypothetical protein
MRQLDRFYAPLQTHEPLQAARRDVLELQSDVTAIERADASRNAQHGSAEIAMPQRRGACKLAQDRYESVGTISCRHLSNGEPAMPGGVPGVPTGRGCPCSITGGIYAVLLWQL